MFCHININKTDINNNIYKMTTGQYLGLNSEDWKKNIICLLKSQLFNQPFLVLAMYVSNAY